MKIPWVAKAPKRVALTVIAFSTGLAIGAVGLSAAVPESTTTSTVATATSTQPAAPKPATTPTTTPPRVAQASSYLDCSMPNPGDNALAMTVSTMSDLGYSSPFWPAGSVRLDDLQVRYEAKVVPDQIGIDREPTLHFGKKALTVNGHVSTDGVDGPLTTPYITGHILAADRPDVTISSPHCTRDGVAGAAVELVLKSAVLQVTNRALDGNANNYSISISASRAQLRLTPVVAGSWAKPNSVWMAEAPAWSPGPVVAPGSPPPCEGEGSPDRTAVRLSLGSNALSSTTADAWPSSSIAVSNVNVDGRWDVAGVDSTTTNQLPTVHAVPGSSKLAISFSSADLLLAYDLLRLNVSPITAQVGYATCTYAGVARSSATYRLSGALVTAVGLTYDGFRLSVSGQLIGEGLSGTTTKPTGLGTWGSTSRFGS